MAGTPSDIMLEMPPAGSPESQILQIQNVAGGEFCRQLCHYMDEQYAKNPGVSNEQRTAFCVPINSDIMKRLHRLVHRLIEEKIEPYFCTRIEWWEAPQLLRYEKGGAYGAHSDSENHNKDPDNPGWVKVKDRDVSMLLYLSDDFTGGELYFPDHDIRITPKAGSMVAFPSHHGFRHSAEPTTSGVRHVLVTWAAAKGVGRVRSEAPGGHVLREHFNSDALSE